MAMTLDDLQRLCERATPLEMMCLDIDEKPDDDDACEFIRFTTIRDRDFLIAARTALPKLLAFVRADDALQVIPASYDDDFMALIEAKRAARKALEE